ncbi:MAG: aldehyde oxidase [Myxococcales bacterium]|nr:aldehyde oxidase [Myxococcales bacterium]
MSAGVGGSAGQTVGGTPGRIVGGRHGKIDAIDAMVGATKYTDDLSLPRMLHAKLVRSPYAHARIVRIDTSRAEALEGVHAVITGADMPERYGVIPWTPDEQALAADKARFVGDAVAAVAAVSEEVAAAACQLVHVQWEVLPALTTPAAALASPLRIHEANKHGNVTKHVHLDFGDVDAGLRDAALVVEGHYGFHGSTHAPLEPHCAIGWQDAAGLLTVWSSTQVPHYLHRELAKVLGLPAHRIRVIQPAVGGAFGGKSEPFDLEFAAALLAIRTGRPVKLLYTREEVFLAHRGRHPFDMHYRTGFAADGRILAVDAKSVLDGGAYSSFGLVTTYYSGQLLASPYVFGAYRFDSTRVYTNKPACGPKRGHGSVQPRFAIEVQLDKAARALAIDPIELRRRNFIGADSRTINGFHVGSNGFLECLDKVEEASGWRARRGHLPRGRGLGVAGSTYISGTNYCIYPSDLPQSGVQLCLDRSGRVRVFAGTSDIGQGSTTMLATLVADELGVALDDVRVLAADTDLTPVDLGAYSSRITLMAGNAALVAARDLSGKVKAAVAEKWQCAARDIVLCDRRAQRLDDPAVHVSIQQAFQWAEAKFGTLGSVGSYDTPRQDVHGDYRGGTIGASPAYSFTAHVVEVEVDEETGDVRVLHCWCAHDCGKALSPVLVEGQIEGSVYMGLAEALLEHHEAMPSGLRDDGRRRDPGPGRDGLLMASSLLDYRMPTALDVGEFHALIVEHPDPRGPHGAKEAGEGPLHSAIPALCNAIFDAVGVRIDELPVTPAKILAGLRAQRAAAANAHRPMPATPTGSQ